LESSTRKLLPMKKNKDETYWEQKLVAEATDTSSPLNQEIAAIDKTLKSDKKMADRLASELEKLQAQRKLLQTKICNYQVDIDHLESKVKANELSVQGQRNAKRASIKMIKKHKLLFSLNDCCPSLNSEATKDLEDQEVYLDTWIDVRNRCNELVWETEADEADRRLSLQNATQ